MGDSSLESQVELTEVKKQHQTNMIIPTEYRLKIWKNLFQEGVMVAKKDTRSTHDDIKVRNLYVMKALQSLKSKGFVKENYTWQHYHWALTDEGITYLREQLSLPENVKPNTLKRTQEPQARPDRRPNKVGEGRPVYRNRDGYRRNQDGGADKAGEAGAGNQAFQYKGGYGRGKPANMNKWNGLLNNFLIFQKFSKIIIVFN